MNRNFTDAPLRFLLVAILAFCTEGAFANPALLRWHELTTKQYGLCAANAKSEIILGSNVTNSRVEECASKANADILLRTQQALSEIKSPATRALVTDYYAIASAGLSQLKTLQHGTLPAAESATGEIQRRMAEIWARLQLAEK